MNSAILKEDLDRSQILNGELFMAPSPFGIHQKLVSDLFYEINSYIRDKKTGRLFVAPLDVILEPNKNRVQPDLIYISNENMSIYSDYGWIEGAPDLVIEIISAGTLTRDTVDKFEIYQNYGISEYWIVFPEQKCIEVFTIENGKYTLFCSTENTEGKVFSKKLAGLELSANKIFG